MARIPAGQKIPSKLRKAMSCEIEKNSVIGAKVQLAYGLKNSSYAPSIWCLIAITVRNEENAIRRVQPVAEFVPNRFSIRRAAPELTELSILVDSNTEEKCPPPSRNSFLT